MAKVMETDTWVITMEAQADRMLTMDYLKARTSTH